MKTEPGVQANLENNSNNSSGGGVGSGSGGERDRDRRNRGSRASRFTDVDGNNGGGGSMGRERSHERLNCRVYISNIPYDYRWQDLKDLFRRMVGSVEYVELFYDESGKPRGCGIVEFKDPANVKESLEIMNRYQLNGRELVVKEDHGERRDPHGRILRDGAGGGGGGGGGNRANIGNPNMGGGGPDNRSDFFRRDDDRSGRNNFNMMSNDFNNSSSNYNYYGLSASFLESLGINGPLHNKVFVANLDYKVDSKKLKQVFKLAGKVQSVDLSVDKEGNSRGFAVVEYDHPVEAVQAISMLDRQMLYDRRMTVRLDRIPDKGEGVKLPDGLGGIGIGLGPNGEPLRDVARNLPNMNQQQNQQNLGGSNQTQQIGQSGMLGNLGSNMGSGNGGGFNNAGVQPSPVMAPVQASKSQANLMGNAGPAGLNLNNLSSSNLAALGVALSNPLLSNSLSSLGLNVGSLGGGNDDSIPSGNASLGNNYSTGGNNYSSGFGSSSGFNSGTGNAGGGGGGNSLSFNAYNSGGSGGGGNDGDFNASSMDMFGGGGVGGNIGGVPNVGAGNVGTGNAGARKSDTVVIKNLPLSCTWQTLRDKFRDVGEVKFAEIRGNDVGVVRFFKERDAELAIALMDGSRIDNRSIKVQYF